MADLVNIAQIALKHGAAVMQAKDIPETPILRFLAAPPVAGSLGAVFYDKDDGMPYPNSLSRALPDGTPLKVAKAKIAAMKRRGLVDACLYGCRGDIEITDAGLAVLAAQP